MPRRRSAACATQLSAQALDGVRMANEISRRPASEADREFLYDLLRESLGPHIEATYGPWDEKRQRRSFLETTDLIEHEIVELDGASIGSLHVEEHQDSFELHRIFILPENQNRGIGTRLVREILSAAASKNKSVRLQVFRVSPAIRFYHRLGFQDVGETETHVLMEHAV